MLLRATTMLLLSTGSLTVTAANTERDWLEVTPTLCVAETAGQACVLSLQLRWSAASAPTSALCVYADDRNEPLHCANSTSETTLIVPNLQLLRDTRFLLRRQRDGKLLAQAVVTVAHVIEQLRPRRRHGWGVF